MTRLALLGAFVAVVVVVACSLNPPDYGRPCDARHACPDGYQCFQNACVPPDFPLLDDAGVADGGVADAGP